MVQYFTAEGLQKLKEEFKTKEFWLFTGYNLEDLQKDEFDWVFMFFDVIKVGPYVEELKQERFPASSNQKVLKKGVDY